MGSYISRFLNSEYTETFQNDCLAFSASKKQGFRSEEEDRFKFFEFETMDKEKVFAFFVCDGHSGSTTANMLIEELPKNLQNLKSFDSDDEYIKEICYQVDNKILKVLMLELEKNEERDMKKISGSTMCMVLICPLSDGTYKIKTINVGDSKAVAFKDNKVLFKTIDHKPGDLKEKDRIERNGGNAKYGRVDDYLAMSRAFGDPICKQHCKNENYDGINELFVTCTPFASPEKRVIPEPDIENYVCEKGTTIILGSDGLFNTKPLELDLKIIKFTKLMQEKNINYRLLASFLTLFAKANNNYYSYGQSDNITSIVICLDQYDSQEFQSVYVPDKKSFDVSNHKYYEDDLEKENERRQKDEDLLKEKFFKNAAIYGINEEQLNCLMDKENKEKYHDKMNDELMELNDIQ
jgi:serine/threonine protein phosphatase PrpC